MRENSGRLKDNVCWMRKREALLKVGGPLKEWQNSFSGYGHVKVNKRPRGAVRPLKASAAGSSMAL